MMLLELRRSSKKKQSTPGGLPKKPSGSIPIRPKDVPKDDVAAEKLQQATERDEEKVWLDPNDLAGRIPFKNVNNSGRLLQISKKLSYFLRGHPMEYNLPCPSFNFLDLSVEWEELMTYMRGKIWELEDWEVLQVVRSSDSRRFQIQGCKARRRESNLERFAVGPSCMSNISRTQQSVVEGSPDFLTCQMFVHA